jgi:deoxyribodipyrimidine photo-lyase
MSCRIFLFRRDLRCEDNVAWQECVGAASPSPSPSLILPMFLFHERQVDPQWNPYYGEPSVRFLVESLIELKSSVDNLFIGYVSDEVAFLKRVERTLKKRGYRIDGIHFNRDVTGYANRRDAAIINAFGDRVFTNRVPEYTLLNPETFRVKSTGDVYKVFTPFYRAATDAVDTDAVDTTKTGTKVQTIAIRHKREEKRAKDFMKTIMAPTHQRILGGRSHGLKILLSIRNGMHTNYGKDRDLVYLENSTTHLSAYLKFGCVSVREAHAAMKDNPPLLRQLFWREFYAHIAYHRPNSIVAPLHKGDAEYRNLALNPKNDWVGDNKADTDWLAWCRGTTGVPMVDAGIRQLLQTGYMHNRLRMVTASYLIKNLKIDWRWGERFFAQHLIDYDPAQNNGGWQWVSGTGFDSQPPYRIMNPDRQQKRFDPKGVYIERYSTPKGSISRGIQRP